MWVAHQLPQVWGGGMGVGAETADTVTFEGCQNDAKMQKYENAKGVEELKHRLGANTLLSA